VFWTRRNPRRRPRERPLDAGIEPADRWSWATRYGTTAAEQHAGESLGQRLDEEEPDIDPYAEARDDEDELIRRGYESELRSGRLVAADPNANADGPNDEDTEPDAVAWDAGVDGGGASAEEAAVHVGAKAGFVPLHAWSTTRMGRVTARFDESAGFSLRVGMRAPTIRKVPWFEAGRRSAECSTCL
jgi:hypothetical protein